MSQHASVVFSILLMYAVMCVDLQGWMDACSIQALLSAPNPDDPLADNIAKEWKEDEARAMRTGRAATCCCAPMCIISLQQACVLLQLRSGPACMRKVPEVVVRSFPDKAAGLSKVWGVQYAL